MKVKIIIIIVFSGLFTVSSAQDNLKKISGTIFTSIGPFSAACVSDIIADPTNPQILYASTFTHSSYNIREKERIYRSVDGGETWSLIFNQTVRNNYTCCLAIDPFDTHIMFMGTSKYLYKSTDGGVTWRNKIGNMVECYG